MSCSPIGQAQGQRRPACPNIASLHLDGQTSKGSRIQLRVYQSLDKTASRMWPPTLSLLGHGQGPFFRCSLFLVPSLGIKVFLLVWDFLSPNGHSPTFHSLISAEVAESEAPIRWARGLQSRVKLPETNHLWGRPYKWRTEDRRGDRFPIQLPPATSG